MRTVNRQLPQVAIRIAVGGALIYHSFPFLFTSAGHANLAWMLSQVGLPAPGPTAWFVAALGFFGAIALIVGFETDIAAVFLSLEIVMRVGVIWARGRGFPTPLEGEPPLSGYELNFQYLAGMVALLIAGPGMYSLDRWRAERAAEKAAHQPAEQAASAGAGD